MINITPSHTSHVGYIDFSVVNNGIELGSFSLKVIKPQYLYNQKWLNEIVKILEKSKLNIPYELFLRFGNNDVFMNYIKKLFPNYMEGIEKYLLLL